MLKIIKFHERNEKIGFFSIIYGIYINHRKLHTLVDNGNNQEYQKNKIELDKLYQI